MTSMTRPSAACLLAVLLSGPVQAQVHVAPVPELPTAQPAGAAAPISPREAVRAGAQQETRESLYSESSFQSLTSDRRLHRVGDLVTVVIYETASASSTADTGANRDSSAGLSVSSHNIGSRSASLGTTSDFVSGGRTQRAGRLLAQLTVAVREIAPNQDLWVAGEQLLEINGEKQVIRLEGRVRPRDISELNTVQSTRVADARITFAGDGVLGDRQKPTWWQHLLGLFGF
ncbi:flagellar basal body L-ring protein FlgH [Aquabacterium sp.]|uniref:flagellar basal body L-ring protein FlgH n=1 Tax=Aquabacterium sp. TaxID=1872578 RepID=UPI002B5B3FCC|nr:flagellar basal body L-ring protein FlgH [Aquabacterium sp.]HSW06355.1 flagellar basal body L-ring protein FlgH [Aquabacterium sp.]